MARRAFSILCRSGCGLVLTLSCAAVSAGDVPQPLRRSAQQVPHLARRPTESREEFSAYNRSEEPVAALKTIESGDHPTLDSQPALVEQNSADEATAAMEVITERYPNGAVHIERGVTLDVAGNYVNHGAYKAFDTKGHIVRTGRFKHGQMHGKWTRTFEAAEGEHLGALGLKQIPGPFTSEATFFDGQLNGGWVVASSNGRKIAEWQFENGQLHGKSTWYFTNGEKKREISYVHGDIKGDILEWSADKKIVSRVPFIDGRMLVRRTEKYPTGQKFAEGSYLFGADINEVVFDWWTLTAKVTSVGKSGPDQKRGVWTYWHRNGQKKAEGEFREGVPVGKFVWFYDNGQQQAEGTYVDGQPSGLWVTWHQNGQKESKGEYLAGTQSGTWMHWQPDGHLVETAEATPESTSGDAEEDVASTDQPGQPGAPKQR